MDVGTHAPPPAHRGEVPEIPQVPPPRDSPPAPPGWPGVAVPQPRPATGRIGLLGSTAAAARPARRAGCYLKLTNCRARSSSLPLTSEITA
jgi:hypothetical protein